MVFDTFVALPKTAETYITWPGTEFSEAQQAIFERLLAGISYMGRSESWCEIEPVFTEEKPNCFPLHSSAVGALDDYEEIQVLCPEMQEPDALLQSLLVETAELRTRQKRLDPPGSCWVTYARRHDAFEVQRGKPQRDTIVKDKEPPVAALYALDRFVLPPLQEAVTVGEQARSAVMGRYGRLYDGENSPTLSGRGETGSLTGHRHAFYLPVDRDLDGRVDHLLVYAAGGLKTRERQALGSMREIPCGDRVDLQMLDESRRLKVVLLGFYSEGELAKALPSAGPAVTWRSVTPYVLTRHPKIYRDGRPKLNERNEQVDGPEDQLRREWAGLKKVNADLPEIINITRQDGYEIGGGKKLRWLNYRTRKRRGKGITAGFSCGLQVEFDRPLKGPLALGYGCHYGLGQFASVE